LTEIKSLKLKNFDSRGIGFEIGGNPNRDIYVYVAGYPDYHPIVEFVTSDDTPYQKIAFDGYINAENINDLSVSHLIVTNVLPSGEVLENPSVKIFTCKYCDTVDTEKYLGLLGRFPSLKFSEIIAIREIVLNNSSLLSQWILSSNINQQDHTVSYRFTRMEEVVSFEKEYILFGLIKQLSLIR
jgi:hypothetical protein